MSPSPEVQKVAATLPPVPAARRMSGYRYVLGRLLGEDVCSWVRRRIDTGENWSAVAREMHKTLAFPEDIEISRQLLQKWCSEIPAKPDEERAPAPAEEDE